MQKNNTTLITALLIIGCLAGLAASLYLKQSQVVPPPSTLTPAPTPVATPAPTPVSPAPIIPPKPAPPPVVNKGCATGGCSGEVCADADKASDIATPCIYRAEFACYKTARCERQANGKCEWTNTPELASCLKNPSPAPTGSF